MCVCERERDRQTVIGSMCFDIYILDVIKKSVEIESLIYFNSNFNWRLRPIIYISLDLQHAVLTKKNDYPAQSAGAVEYTDCISAKVKNSRNVCLAYDIKPSDGDAPVLELWETWSTPSLLLLPGPLWSCVLALDRVLF